MLSRVAALASVKQGLKTAIAGVIALLISALVHLPEGYWAAISALIVMQSNVGATLNASRTRLAGTAVGALTGGLFVALLGGSVTGFAVAVAVTFVLCDLLRLTDSQRLATVTVAIVMLTGRTSAAWTIALHRFAEVAIGIVVALLVSLTLWPNHARRGVRQGLAAAITIVRTLYEALMQDYRGQRIEADPLERLKAQADAAVRTNSVLLQNALQEAFGPLKERERLALLVHQVQRIFQSIETLELAIRDGSSDAYFRNFDPGLEELEEGISGALDLLSKSILGNRTDGLWPNLKASLESVDEEATRARKAGMTQKYSLDEVLRFYFLLLTSRNLAQELETAHSLVPARGN